MALQTPDAPPTSDPDIEAGVIEDARRRQLRHRLAWLLPAAAAVAAGLIFAFAGGGSNNAANNPGLRRNTSLLRRIQQAVSARPGTIVVQINRTSSSPPNDIPGVPNAVVNEEVVETPAGRGPQNFLYSPITPVRGEASDYGVVDGMTQYYRRKPNTIYISSVWGPYITKGKKPGTFIFTPPKRTWETPYPQWTVDGELPPKPLTLTAAQAHAVLDGSDTILAGKMGVLQITNAARMLFDSPVTIVAGKAGGSLIAPVLRFPVLGLWLMLKSHELKVVGLTTVDGRRAIELAGPKLKHKTPKGLVGGAGVKFWVDAKTYAPIKEVSEQIPRGHATETWLEYKTLPITAANRRFLSPLALHPHAHVDRNYNDYVNATYQSFEPQTPVPWGASLPQ